MLVTEFRQYKRKCNRVTNTFRLSSTSLLILYQFELSQTDLDEGEYSTRIRRDRANKQKSCVHKISCFNGDNLQLEQMKIIPNCKISSHGHCLKNSILDLKSPVLGVQRHSNFKELRKPFRVSKPKNSTVSLVCMSGNVSSIPPHSGFTL